MRISIVIPAYNEVERIAPTLEAVATYMDAHHPDFEIVVVNNASTDGTRALVVEMQPCIPRLRLLDEPVKGKGAAVVTGMRSATGDVCVFTDADHSTSINHLENMLPYLEQGYEVVIASIAVPGARVLSREAWYRRALGTLGNFVIRTLAVPGIHDTQRGFKVFTARATRDIFSEVRTVGWGFDVEVLALARKKGYRIREVPVTWNNGSNSHVTWTAYPRVLWETVRVWWRMRKV